LKKIVNVSKNCKTLQTKNEIKTVRRKFKMKNQQKIIQKKIEKLNIWRKKLFIYNKKKLNIKN
jgi:hypothetical protein